MTLPSSAEAATTASPAPTGSDARFFGGSGDDTLYGGSGNDNFSFYGGSGADSLSGDVAVDFFFFGGSGDDSLFGDEWSSTSWLLRWRAAPTASPAALGSDTLLLR